MNSILIAHVLRPIVMNDEKIDPRITKVEHLSSYNWIESSSPTIAVPGCPPLWSPPQTPLKVAKDSGLIYIAQNAFRHPECPLEPLIRSLYIEQPSYDIQQVDLITDRNNIRKLLSFINNDLGDAAKAFTIEVEVIGSTAIFCRAETETHRFIGRYEFRGHGHEFEKAFTESQVPGSTGHHRIISYDLGGLKMMVRYETDAYIEEVSNSRTRSPGIENKNLSSLMDNLSLSESQHKDQYNLTVNSKLTVLEKGHKVPIRSTLEIKTRVSHRPLNIQEVLPQLWVSQTPKLIRGYHTGGIFGTPEVEDVTCHIAEWEQNHVNDIRRLISLLKEIMKVVTENGGMAVIKHDGQSDSLTVWKRDGSSMLPEDLRSKFEVGNETELTEGTHSHASKTRLKIGDHFYDVDISKIPYLSAFVSFQRLSRPQNPDLIHGDIALFDVALRGLELGYRQCFRALKGDIAQYHILCETFHFLGLDVLAGQSVDEIFADLRACKTDYELDYKRYRAVKGDKSQARDAAFQLLFMIIRGEFRDEKKDSVKVYNAVLFIVSHPGTFKQGTRTAVRSVFEERFVVSKKQQIQLDRWRQGDTSIPSGEENTTEDDFDSDEPYNSEWS
ncbi:hypothetical protein N7540_011102 [Penicillium herquei]|nr:hypothetical protein N7540_011102 [Penicillium herquei]